MELETRFVDDDDGRPTVVHLLVVEESGLEAILEGSPSSNLARARTAFYMACSNCSKVVWSVRKYTEQQ
jgi:hypothetical protein